MVGSRLGAGAERAASVCCRRLFRRRVSRLMFPSEGRPKRLAEGRAICWFGEVAVIEATLGTSMPDPVMREDGCRKRAD